MKKSSGIINTAILVLGILMILYYLLNGIIVRFGQSLMFMWLVAGALCVGRFFYWRNVYRTGSYPKNRKLLRALRILLVLLLVLFIGVECVIAVGGITSVPEGLDYIIVLGARANGTEPSGALWYRISSGARYLRNNPDTVAVLSGGQGADEQISEAECMRRKLVDAGIDESRLIIEDRSTDTQQNMIFSRELIGDENARVGIVTNDFHMFRALRLARGAGLEHVYGIPVVTSKLSWPHYMMREFCGVMYDGLMGNLG